VRVTCVVLAAGGSRRLGRPKQLLAYRGTTLLGASLERARACHPDQLIVTLGAGAEAIRSSVDLEGTEVAESDEYTAGCSSSIKAALDRVDPRSHGIVLMLGDQPEVTPEAVARLVDGAGGAPLGICRYEDGPGHPFWIRRDLFYELRRLHGDKAVWKLAESGRHRVIEVPVPGPIPLDVDTWEDYRALLGQRAEPVSGGAGH
jgi:molybdenum cofactor cytidylyltransferase